MRLSDALSPALLGRETRQLAIVAALSILALLFAPRWLQVVAGVVDAAAAVASLVGVGVAWPTPQRAHALTVYGTATVVFVLLAVLNLLG